MFYLDDNATLNPEPLMGDVVCPDNLFDNIILNDAADVSLERDTSSLRLAELVPHEEDFSRQSDQENNDPVIRVVGDQEFILLEPGPSSVENSEGFDESCTGASNASSNIFNK